MILFVDVESLGYKGLMDIYWILMIIVHVYRIYLLSVASKDEHLQLETWHQLFYIVSSYKWFNSMHLVDSLSGNWCNRLH